MALFYIHLFECSFYLCEISPSIFLIWHDGVEFVFYHNPECTLKCLWFGGGVYAFPVNAFSCSLIIDACTLYRRTRQLKIDPEMKNSLCLVSQWIRDKYKLRSYTYWQTGVLVIIFTPINTLQYIILWYCIHSLTSLGNYDGFIKTKKKKNRKTLAFPYTDFSIEFFLRRFFSRVRYSDGLNGRSSVRTRVPYTSAVSPTIFFFFLPNVVH